MKKIMMAAVIGMIFRAHCFAGEKMDMKPYVGSAQFEKIKKLEGKWEGKTVMHGQEQQVTVDYHATSGGSAIVETLFPGTPHEMVSVYHDKAGKLSMTHYCMMQNQPELDLQSSTDKNIKLELAKNSSVKAADSHMHSLEITFTDEDHIVQSWTSFEGGKLKETSAFNLARIK